MPFLFLWSLPLLSDPFYDPLLLNFGANALLLLPSQAHWGRVFILLPCMGIGKQWWLRSSKSWWVVTVSPLFLLMGLVWLFQLILACFYPSKSVLEYTRKQNPSAIFEWDEEKKGWYWHAGEYPPGWEKKVKVINIPVSSKKGPTRLKSAIKSKPTTSRPPTDAPSASRTWGSKRKTTPHPTAERRVNDL